MLSGVWVLVAKNPWQCQNWMAHGSSPPNNLGSANSQWRAQQARELRGRPKIRTPPQHCIYANRSPTDSLRYAAISGSLMASATFAVIHAGTVPVSNPSLGSITRA